MPISHTCHACGVDLADLRPGRDPHYGLRVVVCPDCGAASTRAREPLIAGWRRARRVVGGLTLLAADFAVLIPTLGVSSSLALAIAARRLDPAIPAFTRDQNFPHVGVFVTLAAVAGVWMGVALPHRRVLTRAAAWVAAHALVCAVVMALILGSRRARLVDPADLLEQPTTFFAWFAVAVAAAPIVLLADVPARFGRWLLAFFAASLFRWRRHRARIRRSGA